MEAQPVFSDTRSLRERPAPRGALLKRFLVLFTILIALTVGFTLFVFFPPALPQEEISPLLQPRPVSLDTAPLERFPFDRMREMGSRPVVVGKGRAQPFQ